jgi:uncharacterized protein YjbI with pentapeptide repeats
MSEQQSQSDRPATTTDTKQEGPDNSEPAPERQAELRAAYEANTAAGKAPYEGVRIRTLGEVQWVMRERRWSGEALVVEGKIVPPEGYEWANLSGTDLSGADLPGATLSESNLYQANLSGTDLNDAKLNGARLNFANLRGRGSYAPI